MTLIKIAIGLFGLGIVVFIHELGHFLAARLCKIGVEAFSIGWGNPILKKKIGEVEYRLGMFPIGGYCKFKGASDHGADEYKEAYDLFKEGKKPDKDSFLGASCGSRMLTCFAGPFFNLLFAVLLLSVLGGIGSDVSTFNPKIILAKDITPGETYPADIAGLKTGDVIVAINDRAIKYSHEVQEIIALNPKKEHTIWVSRNNQILSFNITPALDTSTAAGRIGVHFWIDPIIGRIKEGSPAEKNNLKKYDWIKTANGKPVYNTTDLIAVLEQEPEILTLEYSSNYRYDMEEVFSMGLPREVLYDSEYKTIQFTKDEIKDGLGIVWESIDYRNPNLPIHLALVKGVKDTWKTLTLSIKSFRLLFMGIDLTNAVSGPARITYMVGDITAQSMDQGFGTAIRSFIQFIALISIALCIMNLLPLPIIDGGMIILYFVELIRKKPAHPKAIQIFQGVGIAFIFSLMVFALLADILYFIK